MPKRKFHYLDAIAPDPRQRPALRLADGDDAPTRSAARMLQQDIARAFGLKWASLDRRPKN
ncbi:MAG: hypothetical protein KKC14_00775 [Alphaproteobacteria bacterium]|nr:hypothetical protein [Alphaproteobacteria bacterium]